MNADKFVNTFFMDDFTVLLWPMRIIPLLRYFGEETPRRLRDQRFKILYCVAHDLFFFLRNCHTECFKTLHVFGTS
jgi:hypothetical protein